jgi:preprotein translocase subunit Sec61beta
MPSSGAGLIRFFEDSSIGIKISPVAAVIFAAALILIVLLAHFGVFGFIFSPAG